MRYEAFFFDFDGVLADSVEVKTRAFAKLFEHYGSEVEAKVMDHHRRHGGMTRVDKFRHYYKEFLRKPLNGEMLDNLCRQFSQLVVDEVIRTPEIKGAKAFLTEWHNRVPCYVISATPEDEIREIVRRRGLQLFFKEVLGTPTSKSENLKELLDKYNLKPAKCLFFGDAESDYSAAKVFGVDFVAILPGHDAPLLREVPDVRWVKDFEAVMQLL